MIHQSLGRIGLEINPTVVHSCEMTRIDPQMKIRLAPDLKERLTNEAQRNRRSINAEIVQRLEASFKAPPAAAGDFEDDVLEQLREIRAILDEDALGLLEGIHDALKERGDKKETSPVVKKESTQPAQLRQINKRRYRKP